MICLPFLLDSNSPVGGGTSFQHRCQLMTGRIRSVVDWVLCSFPCLGSLSLIRRCRMMIMFCFRSPTTVTASRWMDACNSRPLYLSAVPCILRGELLFRFVSFRFRFRCRLRTTQMQLCAAANDISSAALTFTSFARFTARLLFLLFPGS